MLEIKNLRLKYIDSKDFILDGISFNLRKGEIFSILGPSGCGKTTLINAIGGLLDENEVILHGEVNLHNENIGIVFQTPSLIPWKTAYENISIVLKKQDDEKILRLFKMVDLQGYEGYFPKKLSIGMQQRLNFIRALAIDPDILLLDEPFSALDTVTKKKIMTEFKDILEDRNIACIFVTHNENEAEFLSKKIIYLTQKPTKIKKTENA
ncbi:MAG: ATP-binding cassette domain-containing protein [Candidatus Gracilibacteria bacterium]|nr:ATP-binding cassette domain-containing protein [Candidatus Gracilibacteria bacterium]